MTHKDDDLLTVPEVIAELRIHRSTWQKMVKNGEAPPIVKIASAQRIRYGAFREWLKSNETRNEAA